MTRVLNTAGPILLGVLIPIVLTAYGFVILTNYGNITRAQEQIENLVQECE